MLRFFLAGGSSLSSAEACTTSSFVSAEGFVSSSWFTAGSFVSGSSVLIALSALVWAKRFDSGSLIAVEVIASSPFVAVEGHDGRPRVVVIQNLNVGINWPGRGRPQNAGRRCVVGCFGAPELGPGPKQAAPPLSHCSRSSTSHSLMASSTKQNEHEKMPLAGEEKPAKKSRKRMRKFE
ncbi:hypothetical protein PGT21_030747 [Puccinia graminis f. sp. tritici]|uniref:Uncharacterized protein n=1 Tax=Puccinia graminis f. sp. tritici TaxID=56615 RepID=A0A5B0PFQ1_PUCGR|nr:hypothetical protein PGT21_030747 [Puccinia graminis f. sp. tritici]KAA1099208.1 hypothetical protein PGTUg99_022037 [Puccinia graminis f. sp. tritici]